MDKAEFVVVANRLPVDRTTDANGEDAWRVSPGGLVTALEPVMRKADGAWVGWAGQPDVEQEPFEVDGTLLIPVTLSAEDVEQYYEGFSNDTIWPLYHDVIAEPRYRRLWWDAYVRVNRRFAEAAAEAAEDGGTVWVQDYQLQLVPRMLRDLRPDLVIGYFHHIPFPAYGLYSQLPWRRQVLEGLLGADVVGFQRVADAGNFARAVRRQLRYETKASGITVPEADGTTRISLAKAFPISIDSSSYIELARRPDVQERARQIRESLGNPKRIFLGVDRLDYTKGIRHRLKAYGELLTEGRLSVDDVTLVQVASPSRERVAAYIQLRDEIELTVGRTNGDFDTMGHTAIRYLHQAYPREEMVALFLAADVMLVTALRDGMNLVAKEYVASRVDNRGVLILSEFAGAADELGTALRVNPHDIEGLKETMMRAVEMTAGEQGRRMRAARRRVLEHSVEDWSREFLEALDRFHPRRRVSDARKHVKIDDQALRHALGRVAASDRLLVALDFDGTLAPLEDEPMKARALPVAAAAVAALAALPDTPVAFVSGRSLHDLREIAEHADDAQIFLAGSHGAEFWVPGEGALETDDDEIAPALRDELRDEMTAQVGDLEGVWVEPKTFGFGIHTRVASAEDAQTARDAADRLVQERAPHWRRRTGHNIVEYSFRHEGKDSALAALRKRLGATAVLFAGDDVTDEDALASLGPDDLGIRVGEGETAASVRVGSIQELAAALSMLARMRADRRE
ncbi:MAG TPA: bifunctional alpha,alpha-trehalose-phosphate synthase (UDP-forming)/trehalose-phosphatase [Microbacterium sp.]|nr:bifunctional alpha,alpha-trehalose-phosphate synthase (UDP-forming)/trehalose-phosphatase [Microbacterium sp.]